MMVYLNFLRKNARNLKTVDFGHGFMTPGALFIAQEIFTNTTVLAKLLISSLGISSEAAISLFSALKHNCSMEVLDLSFNPIEEKGALALSSLMKSMLSLVDLDISHCNIGSAGAIDICQVAAVVPQLRKLNMEDNLIDDVAARNISGMLKTNQSLRHLDLSSNYFSELSIISFLNALHQNSSLEIFHLGGNGINDRCADELITMFRNNHVLNVFSPLFRLREISPNHKQAHDLLVINSNLKRFLQDAGCHIIAAYQYISEVLRIKQSTIPLSFPDLRDIASANYIRLFNSGRMSAVPRQLQSLAVVDNLHQAHLKASQPLMSPAAKKQWLRLSLFNNQEDSMQLPSEQTQTPAGRYQLKIDI
jgi:Ran GTPase-activating protein (RanGAP) involved in mRNA processing and transport